MHLISVGNDGINKLQSMLKSAGQFLQHRANSLTSCELQPRL